MTTSIGFIGLGTMGRPMALNLIQAGYTLNLWNRNPAASELFLGTESHIAASSLEVFERSAIVLLMLSDDGAIDAVLERHGAGFPARVRGRLVVHMGTTSACYSEQLAIAITAAGGRYVEAPVSGSSVPAQDAQLVAMLAGTTADTTLVTPLFNAMCRRTVYCGDVPKALQMKFSVNLLLLGMITALAESVHLATKQGLDLATFLDIVLAGQMSNDIIRVKGAKMVQRDFSPEASITTVQATGALIVDAARKAGANAPLANFCLQLVERTELAGHAEHDVTAILTTIEAL